MAEVGGVRSQAHARGAAVGQRGWLVEVERNFCWARVLSARSGCELGGFGPPVVGLGGEGRGEEPITPHKVEGTENLSLPHPKVAWWTWLARWGRGRARAQRSGWK